MSLPTCDSCNQPIRMILVCPDPDHDGHDIVLCGHHGNKYYYNLVVMRDWKVVYDQREWKVEDTGIRPIEVLDTLPPSDV